MNARTEEVALNQDDLEPGTAGGDEETKPTAARREVEGGSAGPTQSGAASGVAGGVTLGAQEEPLERPSTDEGRSDAEQLDDGGHPQAETPPN
jgi:hypothetical protein